VCSKCCVCGGKWWRSWRSLLRTSVWGWVPSHHWGTSLCSWNKLRSIKKSWVATRHISASLSLVWLNSTNMSVSCVPWSRCLHYHSSHHSQYHYQLTAYSLCPLYILVLVVTLQHIYVLAAYIYAWGCQNWKFYMHNLQILHTILVNSAQILRTFLKPVFPI